MADNKPVKKGEITDRTVQEKRLHEGVMDLMRFTEGYFDRSHRLGQTMVSQSTMMYDVSHRVAYSRSDINEREVQGFLRRGTQSPQIRGKSRRNAREQQARAVLLEDSVDLGQLMVQIEALKELEIQAQELSKVEPQIPSILVLDGSKNHETAKALGLELLDSSVIMELDIERDFAPRGMVPGVTFKRERIPFSQEFIDVFRSGFVNNDGFGYNLAEDTVDGLNVFREIEGMTEYAYLAYMDGKAVSIVSFSVDEHNKAYINNVATDPEYRGQGISRALLEHSIEDVASMGVTTVGLYTEIGGLESYYNSIGFESLGVVRNYGASITRDLDQGIGQPHQPDVLVR